MERNLFDIFPQNPQSFTNEWWNGGYETIVNEKDIRFVFENNVTYSAFIDMTDSNLTSDSNQSDTAIWVLLKDGTYSWDFDYTNTKILRGSKGMCYGVLSFANSSLNPSDVEKILFGLSVKAYGGIVTVTERMVELGSNATAYEPYQELLTTIDLTGHEPLRKIGDVADYIDCDNGGIVRNIGKVNLGSLNYTFGTYNTTNYFVCYDVATLMKNNSILMSTVYKNSLSNNVVSMEDKSIISDN